MQGWFPYSLPTNYFAHYRVRAGDPPTSPAPAPALLRTSPSFHFPTVLLSSYSQLLCEPVLVCRQLKPIPIVEVAKIERIVGSSTT